MRYLMMKVANPPKGGKMPVHGGYWMSEKLDGIRCFWDGGVSRGVPKKDVPWANTLKDARYVNEQIATGLWTQYGHVIHAAPFFLDGLPNVVMEGELFAGRSNWQGLSSAVKKQTPVASEWESVRFVAFDCPPLEVILRDGKVRFGPKQDHVIRGAIKFFYDFGGEDVLVSNATWPYRQRRLFRNNHWHDCITERLIYSQRVIDSFMQEVLERRGEGVIVKNQDNLWHTDRAKDVFKIKPVLDGEAKVTGWVEGKGKYVGMLGALICETIGDDNGLPNAVRFELSGMTDGERALTKDKSEPREFKVGDTITFKYRELSDSGVPKEPRYMRMR